MGLSKKKREQKKWEPRPYCIAINQGGTWILREWNEDGGLFQTKEEVKESLCTLNEDDSCPYFVLLKRDVKL